MTDESRDPEPSFASVTRSPSSHIGAAATTGPSSASDSSSAAGTHLGQIYSSAD